MELKEQIIQEYLATGCGYRKLAVKYGISRATICNWVLVYQGIHNLAAVRAGPASNIPTSAMQNVSGNFMRPSFTIIFIFISIFCFSQVTTTIQTVIVDSGKYEFKQQTQSQTPDYTAAYRILTNQVKLNPKNAELRYFLGYTIDRLNADDGKGMSQLKKEMTIKASEQFEEVNRLEPIYKGELFILDPYAKLASIWGSLAEAYLNRKLIDSAKWAFLEGKKRGGFIEPILEFNRQLLNSCGKNCILVTYGDNITIPIWFLQTIENFRSDITVVG
jgi:hypothetical protein